MEPTLKITGTEIWIGDYLFSKGLIGPMYAQALRQAEQLELILADKFHLDYKSAYDEGYEDGESDAESRLEENPEEIAELQATVYDLHKEIIDLQSELKTVTDKLKAEYERGYEDGERSADLFKTD